MVVMVAVDVRIIQQLAFDQRLHCFICAALDAAEQLDASLCQCVLCACADAAADQRVNAALCKQPCKCAMSAAVGADDLGRDDLTVLNVIQLELSGVAKMLEDVAVFISYCDSHICFSFSFQCRIIREVGSPAASATAHFSSVAQPVISAGNLKRAAVDKAVRQLIPCRLIDLGNSCPGNLHLPGSLLMGVPLQVDQPDDLIFIQRQQHPVSACDAAGDELIVSWFSTDPSAPGRSCHWSASFHHYRHMSIMIIVLFSSFVKAYLIIYPAKKQPAPFLRYRLLVKAETSGPDKN